MFKDPVSAAVMIFVAALTSMVSDLTRDENPTQPDLFKAVAIGMAFYALVRGVVWAFERRRATAR